jgi:sarcosine oxidase
VTNYDAVVLGTGGVGSSAAFHLARRGARVLGIDRFPGGHDRGSSHGETRIIRQAYFEHPDYVPLLVRAYELWRELEIEAAEKLLFQVGLLQIGPANGAVVRGVLASSQQHGLAIEQHTAAEIHRRWPGFHVPEGLVGVFESAAGYLLVERSVLAHLAAAEKCGAEFRFGCSACSFDREGSGVAVELESGEVLHADKLIVTAGPWTPQLLADLGVPLVVRRKHVYWFPAADEYHADRGFPTFLFELPHGVFYGFPQIDSLGLKAAEHSGGNRVEDPLIDQRVLDPHDLARVQDFLSTCLPGVGRPHVRHSVCYYTMSPDEHFIVDQHPEMPNVLFAAGLSGHGFKFTSVLGQALAEMALEGQTKLPVDFLGLKRFR